jgi:hypothetical protein
MLSLRSKDNIILVQGAIIIALLFTLGAMYFTGTKAEDAAIEPVRELVAIRKGEIFDLIGKERALLNQMRSDSIKAARETKALKSEIKRLRRELAKVDFETASAPELDSIRETIYGPDSLANDTLYALPIDQAREALESAAREPQRDSVDSAQNYLIDKLERDAARVDTDFKKRIETWTAAVQKGEELNAYHESIADHYRKQTRKQKKLRWVDRLFGGLIGFGAGKL